MTQYRTVRENNIEVVESVPEEETGTGGSLQWPSDNEATSGLWMTFTRKEYSRPSRKENATATSVGNVVALPLPPSFASGYGAQWDNTDFSSLDRAVGSSLSSDFAKTLANAASGGNITSAQDALTSGFQSLGDLKNVKTFAKAWATDFAFNSEAASKAGSFIGLARNPFQAFLYRGPNFRSFEFSYKLTAKNKSEAQTIQNIIKEFKLGMTPNFEESMEDNIFKYPDIYELKASNSDKLFKIAECALTSFNVDYHGEGLPLYHEGKIPVSINISMAFQELRIIMREDILEGY